MAKLMRKRERLCACRFTSKDYYGQWLSKQTNAPCAQFGNSALLENKNTHAFYFVAKDFRECIPKRLFQLKLIFDLEPHRLSANLGSQINVIINTKTKILREHRRALTKFFNYCQSI